jgi:hypothetical protein
MKIIAVDLGQSCDFSALSTLEQRGPGWTVTNLQRLPLGTSYVAQAQGIATRYNGAGQGNLLAIDGGGVGRAVGDILDALLAPKTSSIRVAFTGSGQVSYNGFGKWSVPKVNLVSSLLMMLNSGKLEFAPKLAMDKELRKELQCFKIGFTKKGHATFDGVGQHDDMISSLMIGAWIARWVDSKNGT